MLLQSPTPMSHLREEFTLLLGTAGAELVARTWRRFQLDPGESDPGTLRPALVALFFGGARLAAPRGGGRALKQILRDFEADFFSLSQVAVAPSRQRRRREYLFKQECQAKRWTEGYR